jgi:hypothetical protein
MELDPVNPAGRGGGYYGSNMLNMVSTPSQPQQPVLALVMLAGHGGGYYGPNMLNMGNTSKREPANAYARDPKNWAHAYDETLRLLRAKGGLPQ